MFIDRYLVCRRFLASRRNKNDFIFLFNMVNDYINCTELLGYLNLNDPPCRTRSLKTFYIA